VNLRARIARIEKATRPATPPAPLVVVCRRVGDDGEDRTPGVYYEVPGSLSPTLIYSGEKPDEAILAQFQPARGPGPLIITCGPETVPAPAEPLA
jgi:hypothetical protein